jgi:uncharacterized protein YukE
MSLPFADTAELHAVAHRIRSHSDALRARAVALAARSENAHWHSRAADAFRAHVRQVTATMRSAAGRLDDAADALDRHANRVHQRIEQMERLAAGAVAGGADLIEGVGGAVGSVLHGIGI